MAVTATLGGHNINDGTTYVLADDLLVEPLGVSSRIEDNYADGSQQQVAIKTKVPSSVTFTLKVYGSSAANLKTALDNLDAWCLAGGTLTIANGATNLVSCTAGVSQPPTRVYSGNAVLAFFCMCVVELVRLT